MDHVLNFEQLAQGAGRWPALVRAGPRWPALAAAGGADCHVARSSHSHPRSVPQTVFLVFNLAFTSALVYSRPLSWLTPMLEPDWAARKAVESIAKCEHSVFIPSHMKFASALFL